MGKANPFLSFVSHNKYWIVAIIGVLIVGVVDENSFYRRMKNNMQINELREQISQFNERYEKDEAQLRELRRNPKAITKIARERYFMKTDDEDIFVLSTELPEATNPGVVPHSAPEVATSVSANTNEAPSGAVGGASSGAVGGASSHAVGGATPSEAAGKGATP